MLAGSVAIALLLAWSPARARLAADELRALARMSLEDLMQVEVTSVAGTAQRRFVTPAALYVITAEAIRRAGHRNLAEALRMVPGMHVARINASSWVVGSRGLTASSLTANRYLVQIDGRVVHDPLLSTTFWDTADLLLEDIERIEVVRGPGATLWGVNAMNGVISVITKSAADTQGSLLLAGAGSADPLAAGARIGGRDGAGGAWRIWAKYARHDDFELPDGSSVVDQWSSARAGFRYDRALPASAVQLTVQGDAYDHPRARYSVLRPLPGLHQQNERVSGDEQVDGAHLLARAVSGDDGNGWSLQAYVDQSHRAGPRYAVDRRSSDLDWRQWLQAGRHQWIWGLQYSGHSDEVLPEVLRLQPTARHWRIANAFLQDSIELQPERWYAMLGSKFTYHDFIGFAVQPGARLWWTPSPRQTFWAALSRPLRVPSRFEEEGTLVFSYADTGLLAGRPASGVSVPLALSGNRELEPESLLAWELGHRFRYGEALTLASAWFYNDYRRLISVPATIVGQFGNGGSGRTRGVELVATWQPRPGWQLDASYSWMDTTIDGPVLQFEEDSTPRRLAQLRSSVALDPALEFNGALYWVDRIPRSAIPAYQRLDLGLSWRPRPGLELALWGQNLLDPAHAEASGAQVPRSVYAQLSWQLP